MTTRPKIQNLQTKLERLLDSYLDQDIDREIYLSKKAELLSQKKSLQEKSNKLALAASGWVEPTLHPRNQPDNPTKTSLFD